MKMLILKYFFRYFQKQYAHKTKQWAICYRKYIGLTTNMSLKAMHKKYYQSDHAVMMFAHNEKFKRIIKLKRNKASEKVGRILKSHEESSKVKFISSKLMVCTVFLLDKILTKFKKY